MATITEPKEIMDAVEIGNRMQKELYKVYDELARIHRNVVNDTGYETGFTEGIKTLCDEILGKINSISYITTEEISFYEKTRYLKDYESYIDTLGVYMNEGVIGSEDFETLDNLIDVMRDVKRDVIRCISLTH